MSLKPVERRSLSDDVFQQLAAAIVGGRFAAGAPLPPERMLCEQLAVNRGAVREGVKRLAQAGLVESQHGSGNQVLDYRRSAGLDLLPQLLGGAGADAGDGGDAYLDLILGIMEMRSALAPEAARLCARRGRERAPALEALAERMRAAGKQLPELQDLALAFWDEVIEGSRNLAFRLAYNSLRRVYEPARDALALVLERELTDQRAYRGLAAAIARGDEAGAARLGRSITRHGLDAVGQALAALRRGSEGGAASGN